MLYSLLSNICLKVLPIRPSAVNHSLHILMICGNILKNTISKRRFTNEFTTQREMVSENMRFELVFSTLQKVE